MKKVKLVVLLIVVGLIALIGYQNLGFLFVKQQFGINLGFVKYQTPEIANVALLLGFLAAGFLLAFAFSLRGRWRARRAIKDLTAEVTAAREKITAVEKELADLKFVPQPPEADEDNADSAS